MKPLPCVSLLRIHYASKKKKVSILGKFSNNYIKKVIRHQKKESIISIVDKLTHYLHYQQHKLLTYPLSLHLFTFLQPILTYPKSIIKVIGFLLGF